jgi:tetracycline repressor-like protein
MASSRAEQTERNHARVLAAARVVFLRRGFHATSVEEIAEAAGVSRGVVYSRPWTTSWPSRTAAPASARPNRPGRSQANFVIATGLAPERQVDPEVLSDRDRAPIDVFAPVFEARRPAGGSGPTA